MSDWTGVNSVGEAIRAGCDVEMPGPAKWRTTERVVKEIMRGTVSQADIEQSAGNVLYLIERTKGLGNLTPEAEEQVDDTPERREVIRQAGREGLTLLKNDRNILPIKPGKKVAMIGPNAKRAIASGGGSASLRSYYTVTPFDGLQAQLDTPLLYAQGCEIFKWLPLISDADISTPSGKCGVQLEYYRGDQFASEPVYVQRKTATDLFLWDSAPMELLPAYSFKVKFTLHPSSTGTHTFGFMSVGPGRMFLNGQLFIDNWDWTDEGEAMFEGSEDVLKSIHLQAHTPVSVVIESTNLLMPPPKRSLEGRTHKYGGCRIGYQEEQRVDLLEEAVSVAKESDVAVLVVGVDSEWESEGYDRKTMDLPKDGSQDRLITAIHHANPNTVVVNQSGTPVTMPWAPAVPTILQAWYQGQEAGNALADVLLGHANPSGKLPTTFPKRLEDNPAYHNWPGENQRVVYGEGIYVGYRHYERAAIAPLFPFGHGLSYTTFAYGGARISSAVLTESAPLTVSVRVTNTGPVAGAEVVQAYVRDPKSRLPRPEKELQAFARVELRPAETKTVELVVDKYSVGYYDTSLEAWIAEEGSFEVLVGASSADVRQRVGFEVENSFSWVF